MAQSIDSPTRTVIDLNKILCGNERDEVQRIQNEFESNGWCFVQLPKQLILSTEQVTLISVNLSKPDNENKYAQTRPIYGYSKMEHKESLKLLTGHYFESLARRNLVPIRLIELLNYLSQHFDATTQRLIEVLDQHRVFQEQPSIETLSEKADLPMKEEHFGMLDIVSYFNRKNGFEAPVHGENTNEVNCVPHYDPGLLSLSILSTEEGLQLKDISTNTWIDGSLASHVGVIWLGEAASRLTNNRLKSGIHRVIYPKENTPRLTMWYEVCTIEQLRNISEEKMNEKMTPGEVTFDSLLGASAVSVLPGERRLDFLRRIEKARGLTLTKAGLPRYNLKKYSTSFMATDEI